MALDDQGNYYPSINDNLDLMIALEQSYQEGMYLSRAQNQAFTNYIFYVNENGNLKCQPLKVYFEFNQTAPIYYCQFTENAFILGIYLQGYKTDFPQLSALTPKEIAFSKLPYFKETWIELEDMRKVDSYFATIGFDFNPQ